MACQWTLSKEEQAEAQSNFTKWQAEYNKTKDKNIVWTKLYPIIQKALGPAILKKAQHHKVEDFEDKLQDGLVMLCKRYIKNPNYNYESLATLCYWAAVWTLYRKEIVQNESAVSLDYLLDEIGLYEKEITSIDELRQFENEYIEDREDNEVTG